MDQPPPAATHEALQHQAWLLWDAAGRPPGKSEHFWLMAEQHLAKPTAATKRKKLPASPAPAAETAPVHPSRKRTGNPPAPSKPASKTPAKSAKKAPPKPITPPPAKPRKPKAGEAP